MANMITPNSFYANTILADGPVAYYTLGDAVSSGTAHDSSGNGYDATVTGGVTFGGASLLTNNAENTSATFDGSTGYITLPSGVNPSGWTALTVECWLRLATAPSNNPRLIANAHTDQSGDNTGFELGLNTGAGSGFAVVGNGSAHGYAGWTQQLMIGVAYHYALVYDGTLVRAFLNGVQVATSGSFTGAIAAAAHAIAIGYDPAYAGDFAGATLQHVAIYTTALTAARLATHYRAGAVGPTGNSLASQYVYKQQVVQVFSPSGVYIDTWRDAPLLAGVKFAINSATSPIQVTLPRTFDNFDEAGTSGARGSVAQGNIVQYWLFGPGLPTTGLLKFQGVIDSYAPEITEQGEERVTVTLTPFDSVVGDEGLLGGLTFGTAGVPGSYVDPLTMFDWWFSHDDPLTSLPYSGVLTLDPSNPASSGNSAQYTFLNQALGSIFETARAMLPANWFWRINQSSKTVTRNVPPVTAQHQFVIGQHIVAPQYKKDWSKLKNVAQVVGTGLTTALTTALTSGSPYTSLAVAALPVAVVSGQTLTLNLNGNPTQTVTLSAAAAAGATSVSVTSFNANGNYPAQTQITLNVSGTAHGSDLATFGARVVQLADNRVVDQNTADALAQGLIDTYDQVLVRTKLRIVDYRGDAQTGIGYDIETIQPGDSCQVLNPQNAASENLWDEMQWDVGYWDYSPAATLQQVVIIVDVTYGFDYVDISLASAQPSQDKEVLNIAIQFQDFSVV